MKYKIPKTFMGIPVEGAIERVLKKQDNEDEENPPGEFQNPSIDQRQYIKIPGEDDVISYLELLGYNNLDWKDTHFKLSENGLFMPRPNLFMKHFANVMNCHKNNKPLYFADGSKVPRNKIEDLYKHLTKDHIAVYKDEGGDRTGVWNWLNAMFEKENQDWFIKYARVDNNELKFDKEDLENCLMEDCWVNFRNLNSQGLAIKKKGSSYNQGENIRFWHPRHGAVARFYAGSDWAGLGCGGDPGDSDDSLGVFGVARSAASQNFKDTATDIYVPNVNLYVSKEKILHGKNWNETDDVLKRNNERMMRLPEFVAFLNHLKSQPQNREYQKIFEEVTKVRSPWRSEWIGEKFEKKRREMYTTYRNQSDKITGYLSKNKIPGINLNEWLRNPTQNGLPKNNIQDGDLYYWTPVNGRVAGFDAFSSGAGLACGRGPVYSSDSLGVRAAKQP